MRNGRARSGVPGPIQLYLDINEIFVLPLHNTRGAACFHGPKKYNVNAFYVYELKLDKRTCSDKITGIEMKTAVFNVTFLVIDAPVAPWSQLVSIIPVDYGYCGIFQVRVPRFDHILWNSSKGITTAFNFVINTAQPNLNLAYCKYPAASRGHDGRCRIKTQKKGKYQTKR